MRAIWNGTVIAEAEHTVVVEGNHYAPGRPHIPVCGPGHDTAQPPRNPRRMRRPCSSRTLWAYWRQ